jgi:hypothetical protein
MKSTDYHFKIVKLLEDLFTATSPINHVGWPKLVKISNLVFKAFTFAGKDAWFRKKKRFPLLPPKLHVVQFISVNVHIQCYRLLPTCKVPYTKFDNDFFSKSPTKYGIGGCLKKIPVRIFL